MGMAQRRKHGGRSWDAVLRPRKMAGNMQYVILLDILEHQFCSYFLGKGLTSSQWIDTCCIDKSSSAELSEAINSMFRWYRAAQVCYAYLSDVSENERDHYDIGSAFRESKWFTRGWTLQELLAPRTVIFYNCGWCETGNKRSLETLISAITGIEHLFGFEKASVAQKMSWASKRETLREEDMAYCLLGLFGVNMPPLYGEGGKAFLRLQNEIMKVSDDESIFAWVDDTMPNAIGGLLARSPAAFKDSWDIEKCYSLSSQNLVPPYLMTNKGLQITLCLYLPKRTRAERLRACKNGVEEQEINIPYTAFLACVRRGKFEMVAVKLAKHIQGREEYSRISCDKLYYPIDQVKGSLAERTIFIRQNENYIENSTGN